MARYIVYTYQFSPVTYYQTSIGQEIVPSTERKEKKQDYLNGILSSERIKFKSRGKLFAHKMLLNESGVFIFKLANNRNTNLEEDFQKRPHVHSPSCFVIIDNRKDVQRIIIEYKSTAFPSTEIVMKILQSTFLRQLDKYGLEIEISKEYQESEFWDILTRYPQGIKMVRFQLSYPNLPRIWENVEDVLRDTSEDTNSHKTSLEYESDENGRLILEESNPQIKGLAKASADSGSVITIKAKGIRRYIRTGDSEKSLEIDDLEAQLTSDILEDKLDKILKILNKIR